MDRLVPDSIQQRLVAEEHALVTTDPERELSGPGPARPPAHRGVQHMDAPGGEDGVDPPDEGRGACGEVEVDLARAHACEQPLVAEGDRLHLGRARQRGEHHFGGLGHPAGHVCPRGARREVGCGRFLADVVDDQLVAALADVGRHAVAHDPQANEPDLHGDLRVAVSGGRATSVGRTRSWRFAPPSSRSASRSRRPSG